MSGATPQLENSIVRAGAGAGKTTGLVKKVSEVYELYMRHGRTPRIVLTTFTRKATQELKERLIQKACKDRDPRFLQFVSDPASLQISTIHGLLNIFLRQVGHLANLDAGFQIVDGVEVTRLGKMALRETLLENPEGLRFFETYGFHRVLEMCQRFDQSWREQNGIQSATIEDLKQAAHEQAEAWKARLNELAASILEEIGEESWFKFANELRDFASSWNGNAEQIEDLPKKPRRSKKQAEYDFWHDQSDAVLKEFKEQMREPCWRQSYWPRMISEWSEFAKIGETFVEKMDHLKTNQARFDMTDLELRTLQILREQPYLAEIFAENWDFWMVDEFQDTSPLQVTVLRTLIGERPRYFVGDPQQSIYLFRGAEVEVFDQTQSDLVNNGGVLTELKRNWRSQPDLLLWINDFMAALSPAFSRMEPREEPLLSPQRDCVTMIRAADDRSELEAVVSRVAELVESGAKLEQICILGRTHRNLMDVSLALRSYGYPTHVHAARGFSERREIVDALSLWKFLVNPHDNANLMQLLRSPWFYVADPLLMQWMDSRPASLWSKIHQLNSELPQGILYLRRALERVEPMGLVRAFEETLLAAAYLDLCLVNDPAGRKESNLWKLIDKAHQLESEGGASLLDLMAAEGLSDPMDSSEGDAASAQEPNCINLMTIHGSKGLEFDHVIVPRMSQAQRVSHTPPFQAVGGKFFFPIKDFDENETVASPLDFITVERQKTREREEFDRWLYVALTRAKETLTLAWTTEPARGSWAARSAWFQKDVGEHETQNYRYRVCDNYPSPNPFARSQKKAEQIKALWSKDAAQISIHQSVTDLLARNSRNLKTEDLLLRWRAQSKGSRIHKALEALKYKGEWSGEFDEAIEYVLGLQKPPMEHLIKDGHVEWGFQVMTAKGIVEGQIDLWAKLDGKIFVIDYKSGSEAYKEDAFKQLSLYAWALRKFGHQEPIEMIVIYPLKKKLESREFSADLWASWENEFSIS